MRCRSHNMDMWLAWSRGMFHRSSVPRIGHVPEMPYRATALPNAEGVVQRASNVGLGPAHRLQERRPTGEIGTDGGRQGTAGAMRIMRVHHLALQQLQARTIIKHVGGPGNGVAALDYYSPSPTSHDLLGSGPHLFQSGHFTANQHLRFGEVGRDDSRQWDDLLT